MLKNNSLFLNCGKRLASFLIFVTVSHATEFEPNDSQPSHNAAVPSEHTDVTSHIIVSSRMELNTVLESEHKPSHLSIKFIPSYGQLDQLKAWLSQDLNEAGMIHTLTVDQRIFSDLKAQFRTGKELKAAIGSAAIPSKRIKKSDLKVHTLNVRRDFAIRRTLTDTEIEVYEKD